MTVHNRANKRKPGERACTEPGLKLLKPGSGCSTPELASEVLQEVTSRRGASRAGDVRKVPAPSRRRFGSRVR